MRMFLSLGSNIEPRANLPRALAELRRAFRVEAVSPTYLTAPVGDADQPDFFNLAVAVETDLAPEEVHAALREIEDRLGRQRDPLRPYGPRTVDLDLVLVPGVVGKFGALELPSPLVAREAFVAQPLADLAPDLLHPTLGAPLEEVARTALSCAARPPRLIELESNP
jgi:2-amino-4-hydroxy-6-hydroxymethyldihydropteridine diphosphokinase